MYTCGACFQYRLLLYSAVAPLLGRRARRVRAPTCRAVQRLLLLLLRPTAPIMEASPDCPLPLLLFASPAPACAAAATANCLLIARRWRASGQRLRTYTVLMYCMLMPPGNHSAHLRLCLYLFAILAFIAPLVAPHFHSPHSHSLFLFFAFSFRYSPLTDCGARLMRSKCLFSSNVAENLLRSSLLSFSHKRHASPRLV